MTHALEAASSGRAKCRACSQTIGKGEVRFGERAPNLFGDGEMTLWFHPACAALAHPEPLLELIEAAEDLSLLDDVASLEQLAKLTQQHESLRRISGGQRSPTGRAKCRHCHEVIEKESWRIGLGFFEDGRMQPGGFIHEACAEDYFGTADILDRVRHFSPDFQT
jgi:hypothetical protein